MLRVILSAPAPAYSYAHLHRVRINVLNLHSQHIAALGKLPDRLRVTEGAQLQSTG